MDVNEKEAAEVIAQLNRLASASVELERLLGFRSIRRRYICQNRPLAQALSNDKRKRLRLIEASPWIGLAPIPDIVSLLKNEVGIRVFVRGLPSNIAGVFAFDPAVGACILLNAKHPWERRALTAAHELQTFLTNGSPLIWWN